MSAAKSIVIYWTLACEVDPVMVSSLKTHGGGLNTRVIPGVVRPARSLRCESTELLFITTEDALSPFMNIRLIWAGLRSGACEAFLVDPGMNFMKIGYLSIFSHLPSSVLMWCWSFVLEALLRLGLFPVDLTFTASLYRGREGKRDEDAYDDASQASACAAPRRWGGGPGAFISRLHAHSLARLANRMYALEEFGNALLLWSKLCTIEPSEKQWEIHRDRAASAVAAAVEAPEAIAESDGNAGEGLRAAESTAGQDDPDSSYVHGESVVHVRNRAGTSVTQTPSRRIRDSVVHARNSGRAVPGIIEEFCKSAAAGRRTKSHGFIRNRVLTVGYSLGAGGAERQHSETLCELVRRPCLHKPQVGLFFSLRHSLGHDFFLPRVAACSVECRTFVDADPGARDISAYPEIMPGLPGPWRPFCAWLISCFRRLRPWAVEAWLDEVCVYAGLAAVYTGVPRIILLGGSLSPRHLGGDAPQERERLDYLKRAYQSLAALPSVTIANNCRAGADDYARWLECDNSGIQVIYNGLPLSGSGTQPEQRAPDEDDTAAVAETGKNPDDGPVSIPAGAPVVGSVFRLEAVKDPVLWIEVLSQVADRRKDVHFLHVGDGAFMRKVVATAASRGFGDRLHMPGRRLDVGRFYDRMDVLLLTSSVEGLPNVVLEAQSHGVPVVSSAVGGIAEAVSPGKTAWLVESRDPSEYADRLLSVLDDESWRKRAARLGPELIRSRFTIEAEVDTLLELCGIGEKIRG